MEAIGDAIESHSRPSFGWNIHRTGTDRQNGTTIQRFKQRFRHPAAVGASKASRAKTEHRTA
jgi:hypothetical protein